MMAATKVPDGVLHACKWTPEKTGYCHVSFQFGIENQTPTPVNVEHLQFGVCQFSADMGDYQANFHSIPVSAPCGAEVVISNGLDTIIHVQENQEYTSWINLISDNNASFQYRADLSHVRLYKL